MGFRHLENRSRGPIENPKAPADSHGQTQHEYVPLKDPIGLLKKELENRDLVTPFSTPCRWARGGWGPLKVHGGSFEDMAQVPAVRFEIQRYRRNGMGKPYTDMCISKTQSGFEEEKTAPANRGLGYPFSTPGLSGRAGRCPLKDHGRPLNYRTQWSAITPLDFRPL